MFIILQWVVQMHHKTTRTQGKTAHGEIAGLHIMAIISASTKITEIGTQHNYPR